MDERIYDRIINEKGNRTFDDYFETIVPISKKELLDISISDLNTILDRISRSYKVTIDEIQLQAIFNILKRMLWGIIFDEDKLQLFERVITHFESLKIKLTEVKTNE